MKRIAYTRATILLSLILGMGSFAGCEEPKQEEPAKPPAIDVGNRDELKLPGLKVLTKERYVDVDATVCLTAGFLELVACTKGGKEHESIISVDAKPSHMHAALLLLRAKPGNPALAKQLEDGGWVDIAPSGSGVDVSLVFKDDKGELKEHPISKFIVRGQEEDVYGPNAVKKTAEEKGRFPTDTFLFAGSQLYKAQDGTARYASDDSGNVISLSSFGDELLCLPGKHSQDNIALAWEIDPTHLPALGTKVILRLRPHLAKDDKPAEDAAGDKEKTEP